MLPLRVFLLIKESCGDWRVSVHRDFESTIEAWREAYHNADVTGAIHVGFTRLDTSLFEDLSIRFAGKMLLTAPARYAFARIGPCAPEHAGSIEGIPVYVALSGWGYMSSAEELRLASELSNERQYPINTLSQPKLDPDCVWINMFAKVFPQETEMLRTAGIINDESYLRLESKLEDKLRIKIGKHRFNCLLEGINRNSTAEVVGIAPPYILSTPIDQIELNVRSYNCLRRENVKFIRELANYTDLQLLSLKNLGRQCVADIARAIRNAIGEQPETVDLIKSQDMVQGQAKFLEYLKKRTRKQATESPNFEEWLNMYAKTLPQDAEMLRIAGIIDDESYLRLESKLEDKLRIKIGTHRFYYLLNYINHNSPEEVVGIAPPYILSTPIDQIEMSVRSYNCLNEKGIKFISELADYTDSKLLRLKNLGRKSVAEIAIAIITAIGEQPETVDLMKSQHLLQGQANFLEYLKERTRKQATESPTFEDALIGLFKYLDDSNSMVIKQRMGYGTKPATLEEIGTLLGVTRERVRQIEMNICDKEKSKPFWRKRVEEPIKRALANRDTPLPVVALDIVDPWFANINNLEDPLKYVLEKFCSSVVGVVKINGFLYLSAIDQEEWDSAVKEACSVLEHGVSHNWKQSEAKYAVSSILPKKALELCDELFFVASKNAIFSVVEECDEPILTGIGRGADVYVEAAMFESDRPLHFTEIFDRIVAKGRQIDTRRVHNAASEIGLLYGRGTYGLMKHYPLSEEETQEMIETAEEIIASGTEGRQWHCSELLEIMCERGLDMDGRLTQYIINIGLGQSKTLVDLRRLVWMAGKTATRITANDRIEVRQAIESLLRIEGKPLSGPEIRKRLLTEGRGVSGSFQIHEEGSIIRVGKNCWGLVDRDIPFSIEQQKMITEILETTLYRTQKGIHKTEIYEVLKEMPEIESFSTVDPALFISIALSSGRMRYAIGDYLCMSDWSGTRRLTAEEAVRIALEEAGPEGLLTKEMKEIASKIIGVQISSDNIYARLSAIGARPNAVTNRWQIMTDEEHLDIS
jgi:hypothetical protein